MSDVKFLRPKQVESVFGIPWRSLANMRWMHKGPKFYKVGRRVFYKPEDVERWILERSANDGRSDPLKKYLHRGKTDEDRCHTIHQNC